VDLCFGPFGCLVGDLLALAIAFLLAGRPTIVVISERSPP
jgi:hypothetical protein